MVPTALYVPRLLDSVWESQGHLAHKKMPTHQDHHRALSMVLPWGPRMALSLMSKVPLKG